MRMLHAGSPTAEHLRLLTNIGGGVICQLPQLAIAGSVLARVVFGLKSEASLARGPLFFVALLEERRHFVFVSGDCVECVVWDAILHYLGIEDANETVAATDPVVKKAERLACPVSLQPQSEFA